MARDPLLMLAGRAMVAAAEGAEGRVSAQAVDALEDALDRACGHDGALALRAAAVWFLESLTEDARREAAGRAVIRNVRIWLDARDGEARAAIERAADAWAGRADIHG